MTQYENYTPEIPLNDEPTSTGVDSDGKNKPTESNGGRGSRKLSSSKGKQKKVARKSSAGSNSQSLMIGESLKKFFTSQNMTLIVGIILGGVGIWLTVAFISYFFSCVHDKAIINHTAIGTSAGVANSAGEGGARLAEFLINEGFGLGSAVIIFWVIAMSLKLLVHWPRFKSVNFTIKCLVALITLSLIVGLVTIGSNSATNWGGYHGRYVNEFIIHFIGWPGAVVLSLVMVFIFVVICLRDLINWVMRKKRERDARRKEIAAEAAEKERIRKEIEEMKAREEAEAAGFPSSGGEQSDTAEQTLSFGNEGGNDTYQLPDFDEEDAVEYHLDERSDEFMPHSGEKDDISTENAGLIGEKQIAGEGDEAMVVNVNQVAEADEILTPASHSLYKFPAVDLLRPGVDRISVDADEQMENKEKIRKTLLDFDIPILSIEATVGPTVTLYEIRPDRGVKISKIRNLVDDVALSLSAIGVRIIAPIPGKGTVGIEVANKEPLTVSMQTVIKSVRYQESKAKLPMAIGATINNDIYIADLAKMPHLLVAGATGQGKSVGLNAIIASLLYRMPPRELKFVMIDPKMVEFSLYAKIERHYLAKIPDATEPIITDMSKVVATLSSLCEEMDERYQLLKMAEVRHLTEYNQKVNRGQLSEEEGHRFLPYIVVVVDEFADLIMTAGKEVEVPIARLAQKARAVGIHVIIATQRPSTNVITGMIKANFPVRIAFKVSSGVDSKTILDTTGAQQLIGRGDMLISNNSEMIRVQCAFIDTPEVEAICKHIASQPGGEGAYILPEPKVAGSEGEDEGAMWNGEKDPLFEEVARLVVQSNTASTSSLQRRYSIGYNRAGKIMDQLEKVGIVGPATGSKPRQVLADQMQLEAILNSL